VISVAFKKADADGDNLLDLKEVGLLLEIFDKGEEL